MRLKTSIRIILLSFLISCTQEGQRELDFVIEKTKEGQFNIALSYFEKVLIRNPNSQLATQAAREAFKVAFYDIKDYRRSILFLKHLVLYSPDHLERLEGQKKIVNILFENLTDYNESIIEANKLIQLLPSNQEKAKYKIILAKSYFFQNNFGQAENEVEEFLKETTNDDEKFDLLQLKANIFIANKNLSEAIKVYEVLMAQFPEKAKRSNIPLTLSVVYEESGDYKKSISTLETLKSNHPMPDYIDMRIKKVLERKKNQPGARGMRK